MSGYKHNRLAMGEGVTSSSFTYSDMGALLEEMLAPGFFPATAELRVHEIGWLFAADGAALVYVVGLTNEVHRKPILGFVQTAPSPTVPLTQTRKAA
jgi:hypothetical protein